MRDNNHNDIIIEYDKVNKYSYDDIKNLIVVINNTQNKEKTFANQFFSLISLLNKKAKVKLMVC